MKRIITFLFSCAFAIYGLFAQDTGERALLIIDIQEFYFPGGFSELHNPEEAAKNAAKVLGDFRKNNELVVHVQHKTNEQMAINELVRPLEGEKVVTKSEVNSFNGTGLDGFLKSKGVTELVIVGMQTHMCVEGATHAAYDLGFKVTLISDACTTRDLTWNDKTIPWEQVHYSTLNTLKSYSKIVTTDEFLGN